MLRILGIVSLIAALYAMISADLQTDQKNVDKVEHHIHRRQAQCPPTCPRDCQDVRDGGATTSAPYPVYISTDQNRPVLVYCEMVGSQGWLVFLKRGSGVVDFNRNWTNYVTGFGNVQTEYWLPGNKDLSLMLTQKWYRLRVDMADLNDVRVHAEYEYFRVGCEDDKYALAIGPFVGGAAGDSLSNSSNMYFTTRDQDNDWSTGNCARDVRMGGWWHNNCGDSNLNGLYSTNPSPGNASSIFWYSWKNDNSPLKEVVMKYRPM